MCIFRLIVFCQKAQLIPMAGVNRDASPEVARTYRALAEREMSSEPSERVHDAAMQAPGRVAVT
jgi:hypothetical protein